MKYKRIVKMREEPETMKAVNPSITTVYVMSLAYGDLGKLTAADRIIAEAMNVKVSMISQVHNAAKHLYVWTVNAKKTSRIIFDSLRCPNFTLSVSHRLHPMSLLHLLWNFTR